MDISAFSDDNFDTKAWVNNILKNDENTDKNENYTMSIVMKLQLYVQQVNNSLEETSQRVLQTLPKILRDTKNLYEEAGILKQKMITVRDEIIKIEQNTRQSINTIENLDNIENKLCLAKQSLQESDNWTILVNDIEEIFDTKDIELISMKLLSMQKCIKLLVNVNDYEQRKLQLNGLKNRLEALISPQIVQAFNTNNLEQSLYYTRIFKQINHLQQLIKYYHKCQKDNLLKEWCKQLENMEDDNMQQIIYNFYDILLTNWYTQQKWFKQIFPDENFYSFIVDVYIDVIKNLQPNFNECIDAVLKQIDDKLMFLKDIRQITQQFCENLLNLIDLKQINQSKLLLLLQTIYNYFIVYTNKYTIYQQNDLIKKLTNFIINNKNNNDLNEMIHELNLTIPKVFDLVKDAEKTCELISENCCVCGLIQALRYYFLNYSEKFRLILNECRKLNNSNNSEDLNNFQSCLLLLQNCGEVLLKLQQLEQDLTNNIIENDLRLKQQQYDYKLLLLTKNDCDEYESLIRCINDGTKLSILDQVLNEFNKLCIDTHNLTYQIVFTPISKQLDFIQLNNLSTITTTTPDLPDYSFTPQEYITQIGQYLMTLPQHLEPFLFQENPALMCAFKAADQEYNNVLTDNNVDDRSSDKNKGGDLAHVFLRIIAHGTCQSFCDRILSICELNYTASRQLAHDIGYLNNVLQDLGISLSENLQQLALLLKLPNDQYQTQSSGCSARYVATIRQIRNIKSN